MTGRRTVIRRAPSQDTDSKDLSLQGLRVDGSPCALQQLPQSVNSHDKCSPKLTQEPRVSNVKHIGAFSRSNAGVVEKQYTAPRRKFSTFVVTLPFSVEYISSTHKGSASVGWERFAVTPWAGWRLFTDLQSVL